MADDDAPRTVPEMLDAARTGEEFGAVLMGMFSALDKARWGGDE